MAKETIKSLKEQLEISRKEHQAASQENWKLFKELDKYRALVGTLRRLVDVV